MLGLIFIYFVGKAFYDLAKEHNKNNWLFAVLGVVSYYVGIVIGGFTVMIIYVFAMGNDMDEMNDTAIGAMGIPFGILICWLFYRILKSQWAKKEVTANSEVLDSDMINNR
jgi:hypothetical protein